MSKMLEKVARAIGISSGAFSANEHVNWDWVSDEKRQECRQFAYAAIMAMWEPTEDMKRTETKAGNVNWDYSCHVCGGLKFGWQAMIDEALKDTEGAA